MTAPTPGEVAFAYPVALEEGMVRALWEHMDGRWSIVTFRPAVVNAAKTRPIEPECSFSMEELIQTATLAYTSNPAIKDDKNAGKKLAAGVLMFATALKIIDQSEPSNG